MKRTFKYLISKLFRGNRIIGHATNKLVLNGSLLRGSSIYFYGKNNSIEVIGGGNSLTNCTLRIYGDNCRIIIGNGNSFKNVTFWLEDNGSQIIIGDDNRFTGKIQLSAVESTTIQIDNRCLFSSEINITTTDSHSILNDIGERINPSSSIHLHDHIWVGTRTIILKGVEIASDVIVGAGSIVCKSITESHVAVAGNPAKIVKKSIGWNIKRI